MAIGLFGAGGHGAPPMVPGLRLEHVEENDDCHGEGKAQKMRMGYKHWNWNSHFHDTMWDHVGYNGCFQAFIAPADEN